MDPRRTPSRLRLVYVACARSNEIRAFGLSDDGHLDPVQRVAIAPGVTPLAVDPTRRYLYAGVRNESPSALAFAIDSATGKLAALASSPLADPPMYLAVDASGQFLLGASYAGATFSVNAIRADGSVDPEPILRTRTPPRPHCVLTDPKNRYLFVASLGGDAIQQYLFDETTGYATPNAIPQVETFAGSGPRHMVFHPREPVLYVNGELDASICSYAMSRETGRLQAVDRALLLADSHEVVPWGAELAISPDGRFLYASERRTSTLAIFDLSGKPGALRRVAVVPTEEQPRSFAVDPAGRFLILGGELSNHMTVYRIDPSNGTLDACFRLPVGEKPCWITAVDISG